LTVTGRKARTVVLVGGGHAHVQVLRRFAMKPPRDARLVVVLDRPVAVYSGMVPGFVAGDYALAELEIDVVPLARRAGAGVILSAAHDIDPVRHEITFADRPPLRFDLASLDVGSTVRGLDLPGVAEHALATRPIGDFVRHVDARVEALAVLDRRVRVLVVGSGAAGTELAFTLEARLRARGVPPSISVVTPDAALLTETSRATRERIASEADRRGIEILASRRVIGVDAKGAHFESLTGDSGEAHVASVVGDHAAADLVVWATGAAPIDFPSGRSASGLARDPSGFIEVRDTLQTVGHEDVFAVGDCARLVEHRWVPRAGVYAVRQGPILEHNLRARLGERPLRRYRPQRDFLSLLHLGDGRALASKWALAVAGGSILSLKDKIDRRFMGRFQVLDAEGVPRPELAELGAMNGAEDAEMPCGGCAAKLGALPLEAALADLPKAPADSSVLLGLDARDDVAATRDASGATTLHNIDVIRAFCDDPYLVGRVAAANALSDLQAKGGRARHAQAIIGLPELPADEAREWLFQALSGLRQTLDECGVTLLGGHTTIGDALTVGLSVTGDGPGEAKLLRQSGARAGDVLLLTQPLGTGVVLAADMQGLARGEWVEAVHAAMQHTNRVAGEIALAEGAHAATDVTGFGFSGHLLTLLDAAHLGARIDRDAMAFLPGAQGLWRRGLRSTAHPANREAFCTRVSGASETDEAWLFDPQTSGGLLLCVDSERVDSFELAFELAGEAKPYRVGEITPLAEDGVGRARIEISPSD
jgi:selenide,water dikinase